MVDSLIEKTHSIVGYDRDYKIIAIKNNAVTFLKLSATTPSRLEGELRWYG